MSDFDRVRPRTARLPAGPAGRPSRRGRDGKQLLFSAGDPDAGFGSVSIECSRCGETTVVSPLRTLRLSLPSVHLPVVRGHFSSYLTCPACRRRSWVHLSIRR